MRTAIVVLASFGLILSLGCATQRRGGPMVEESRVFEAPLPSQPRLMAVEVVNPSGSVVVEADPDATQVVIDASVRRVERDADVEDRSEYLDVVARIEEGEGGRSVLRVKAGAEKPLPAGARLDLVITTPHIAGARVVNAGGPVELVDATGAVQVDNERGDVSLRTSQPLREPVALTTTSGHVFVQAPQGSRANLTMEAPNGRATVRNPFEALSGMLNSGTRVSGVLNGGTNDVLMRTGEGDALLWIKEKPLSPARLLN